MSEPQKLTDWLTLEKRTEHTLIREEIKAELPDIRERARNRQGLSDAEMMARSGLDAAALVNGRPRRQALRRDDGGVCAGAGEKAAHCLGGYRR